MAHTPNYTRLYIDRSATPNVGISAEEVRIALREDTLDWGDLCASDKVNVWSRYRPMLDLNEPWLVLKDQEIVGNGSHGQVIVPQTSLSVFEVTEPVIGYAAWDSFLGPTPDPHYNIFRTWDFDDYYPSAPCPFRSLNLPTVHQLGEKDTEAEAGRIRVSISIDVEAQLTQGSVLLSDFTLFKSPSMYLGFVFCKLNGFDYSDRCIVTSATAVKLADQSPILLYVDAPDGILSEGLWDCYPVLVVGQSFPNGASASQISSITFYTLPLDRKRISIQPAPAHRIVVHTASVNYGANNVTLQVGFSATMYNYASYTGTEVYTVNGIRDDGTVEQLYHEVQSASWPQIVYDGSGNGTRTFQLSSRANPYREYRIGTADYVYLQYSEIEIIYSKGSYTGRLSIKRDDS